MNWIFNWFGTNTFGAGAGVDWRGNGVPPSFFQNVKGTRKNLVELPKFIEKYLFFVKKAILSSFLSSSVAKKCFIDKSHASSMIGPLVTAPEIARFLKLKTCKRIFFVDTENFSQEVFPNSLDFLIKTDASTKYNCRFVPQTFFQGRGPFRESNANKK